MKNYNLFIFDLDGTLIDSLNDLAAAVNYAFGKLGLEKKSVQEVKVAVGYGTLKLIEDLLPEGKEDLKEKSYELFLEYYNPNCYKETVIYDGVYDLLDTLKSKNKKMALLTNKPSAPTEILLDKLGFAKYFDEVVAGDTYEFRKPNPYGINQILAKLSVLPQDAVMVGDSLPDIEAGKSAGVFTIGIESGYGPEKIFPDLKLNSIGELLNMV